MQPQFVEAVKQQLTDATPVTRVQLNKKGKHFCLTNDHSKVLHDAIFCLPLRRRHGQRRLQRPRPH